MEKLAGEVLLFYHLASPSSPDSDSYIISITLKLYLRIYKNFICLNNFSHSISIYEYQQKEYYSVGEKDNNKKTYTYIQAH